MKYSAALSFVMLCCITISLRAQHDHHAPVVNAPSVVTNTQPLMANALRLHDALNFLGSPLSEADAKALKALADLAPDKSVGEKIQKILDPYCVASVVINPESRVSVNKGAAPAVLIEGGWKTFLVRVENEAAVNSQLEVISKNAAPLFHGSAGEARPHKNSALTPGQVASRFLEIGMYRNRPMHANLSSQRLEYAIVQIYAREKGDREVSIGFHVGAGTEDIGFRNSIAILFSIKPSVKVIFDVKDVDGSKTFGSFIIQDGIDRVVPDSGSLARVNYRLTRASDEFNVHSKSLKGIYPLPSRRLALTDKYPDFFFQPQVYRTSGESVMLPPGEYQITFTRGPEYVSQRMTLVVPAGKDSIKAEFQLKRWVNMSSLGWTSADHHIHAAGCSHYESPEEGVDPEAMIRQIKGEDLNVAAVLTWGPGWYHQKKFFTGLTSKLSREKSLMHYDVEVSGFPSSHAGHIVLLGLTEDDYPGTTKIEDWPTWTGPVLQWAKKQNSLTGYAHSGWGLEPVTQTNELPNSVVPKMDGIGANEYIVTVTQGLIDVFSAGDTPAPWELNMWYHTLNCGFRTRISGETDFPCIYDERVGIARSYFKSNGEVTYENYLKALKEGRSYVSDGRSHIVDFKVNTTEMGIGTSEVNLPAAGVVKVKARTTAWLDAEPSEAAQDIQQRKLYESPYWHIERSRIVKSRTVSVELLFNGKPVDTVNIEADGKWNDLQFAYKVNESGWMALRIFPSAHTNPIFVIVNNKPIQVQESAAWCKKALDQCWKMKQEQIQKSERSAALEMYEKARVIYDKMAKSR